jgi:TPR repeat protein
MQKTPFFLSLLVYLFIPITACSQSPVSTPEQISSIKGQEQLNKQVVEAIQRGNYKDAVALTRQAEASKAEIDFAVGELVLQGLADAEAQQPPSETVEQALTLLEESALTGHRQAIAALAATFYTGVRKGMKDEFLIEPNEKLQACWEAAKTELTKVPSCIAMRPRH